MTSGVRIPLDGAFALGNPHSRRRAATVRRCVLGEDVGRQLGTQIVRSCAVSIGHRLAVLQCFERSKRLAYSTEVDERLQGFEQ